MQVQGNVIHGVFQGMKQGNEKREVGEASHAAWATPLPNASWRFRAGTAAWQQPRLARSTAYAPYGSMLWLLEGLATHASSHPSSVAKTCRGEDFDQIGLRRKRAWEGPGSSVLATASRACSASCREAHEAAAPVFTSGILSLLVVITPCRLPAGSSWLTNAKPCRRLLALGLCASFSADSSRCRSETVSQPAGGKAVGWCLPTAAAAADCLPPTATLQAQHHT